MDLIIIIFLLSLVGIIIVHTFSTRNPDNRNLNWLLQWANFTFCVILFISALRVIYLADPSTSNEDMAIPIQSCEISSEIEEKG